MNERMSDEHVGTLLKEAAAAFRPPTGLKETMRARIPGAGETPGPVVGRRLPVPRVSRRALALVGAGCLVAVALWWFSGAGGPTASAHAELVQAVENSNGAEWVHLLKSVSGEETVEAWFSFTPFRGFWRMGDRVAHRDLASNRLYAYDPSSGTIAIDYFSGEPQVENAMNYYDLVLEGLDRAEDMRKEIIHGKTYTVFTVTSKDGQTGRITVDPQVQRVVMMQKESKRGLVVIAVDYPATGPADIYDLGVPRDARIVDKTPPR